MRAARVGKKESAVLRAFAFFCFSLGAGSLGDVSAV